jgi:hypothetical protein
LSAGDELVIGYRGGSDGAVDQAGDQALKAVRYEWMFWDSAYRMEVWPI